MAFSASLTKIIMPTKYLNKVFVDDSHRTNMSVEMN